jgi:DNA-binding beta-propeller fold protein YncE
MMTKFSVPFLLRSAILAAILTSLPVFMIMMFLKPAPDVLGAHVAPAVIANIPVDFGPNFNLVDSANNRVYVANLFGSTVSVCWQPAKVGHSRKGEIR